MNKPLGGRGKKAPYQTVVVRIPESLLPEVNDLIEEYRDSLLNNDLNQSEKIKSEDIDTCHYKKLEAIEEAKKILAQKKSAKKSIKSLLQVLYQTKIDENNLSN